MTNGICEVDLGCTASVSRNSPSTVNVYTHTRQALTDENGDPLRDAEGNIRTRVVAAGEIVGNSRLVVHELGHVYDFLRNEMPSGDLGTYIANNQLFPQNRAAGGFYGNYPEWQKSRSNIEEEIFADMFLGWVFNKWAADDAGRRRATYMDNYMRNWQALDTGGGR